MKNPPATLEAIAGRIFVVRARKVIVDADLAALYGVQTRRPNEQVRRNAGRFPDDFMLQLSGSSYVPATLSGNENIPRPEGFSSGTLSPKGSA